MGNETVDLEASALIDRAEVTAALGLDPGLDLVVINLKLSPHGEHRIKIWLDDFTLISRRDGQRSQPLAPSQIAGKGAMVVSSTGIRSGGIGSANRRGPIWGGVPGVGDRPRRIGGDEDGVSSKPNETKATIQTNDREKENPLLAVLKAKILTEVEATETVQGQLYFLLDGKHKLKDLELIYKSPVGRLILDFQK
ncbi:MAG: hypothetical protein WKF37_16100 [Bryobacteraceae bacterium]